MFSDPLGAFALTYAAYERSMQCIMDLNLPTLVLGGGGYHAPDVARCWTRVAAVALHALHTLPADVPVHAHFKR